MRWADRVAIALCWMDIHVRESCGDFKFCTRPTCTNVIWFTGKGHWELDVCDTRWVDESVTVLGSRNVR